MNTALRQLRQELEFQMAVETQMTHVFNKRVMCQVLRSSTTRGPTCKGLEV